MFENTCLHVWVGRPKVDMFLNNFLLYLWTQGPLLNPELPFSAGEASPLALEELPASASNTLGPQVCCCCYLFSPET